MEKKPIVPEKLTVGEILNRIIQFIVCGLIEAGVYLVIMLPFFSLNRGLFEEGGTFAGLPTLFFEILLAFLYILPLYFLYFRRNVGFKTCLLRLTEEGWDAKTILAGFFQYTGKADLLIYTGYSLLPLLPFSDVFQNPAMWIHIQSVLFYCIPIPRIVSFLLAMLCFVVQYTLCILLAARYWNKHRLHPANPSKNPSASE